ncbi:hypothetical protein H4582DRAFT_1236042 [Lactarius indigo]|nr:hypothetical protein H4582DRAFT_1236042 [Lactarius indigo]
MGNYLTCSTLFWFVLHPYSRQSRDTPLQAELALDTQFGLIVDRREVTADSGPVEAMCLFVCLFFLLTLLGFRVEAMSYSPRQYCGGATSCGQSTQYIGFLSPGDVSSEEGSLKYPFRERQSTRCGCCSMNRSRLAEREQVTRVILKCKVHRPTSNFCALFTNVSRSNI